jgi:hypothetical protein
MKAEPFINICFFVMTMPIWVMLIYYRIRSRPVRWIHLFVVSFPVGLLLAAILWLFIGRSIPSQKARLFDIPIYDIRSIQINPGPFFSLVNDRSEITNETEIKDIMASIRSSEEYSPIHPSTRWQCIIVIANASGDSYIEVINTPTQGAILYCKTSQQGFIYRTLRSDTLGAILETAAGRKK